MRLLSTFGQLPGTWFNLLLIILAGMAEGVGLILFAPLLEVMTGGNIGGLQWPFTFIVDVFHNLGIPVTLITLLTTITVMILSSLAIGYGQRHLLVHSTHVYVRKIRNELADHLFQASWGYISRLSHGEVINQLITETQRAGNSLRYEILAVAAAVQIVIFIIFSALLSWKLLVITMIFGGLVILVVRPLQRRAKMLGEATNKANRNMSFYGIDFLKGSKLVKVTATEDSVITRLAYHINNLFGVTFQSELNLVQVYFIVQALPVLLITAIIAVSHEVIGLQSASTLVFLLFLARIAPRVAQLQQQMQGYDIASPGMRVMREMTSSSAAEREEVNVDGLRFMILEKGIFLENVSYRYSESSKPVLRNLNLSIGRNQMVAVVGRSGVGKSTLIDLLAGLRRPHHGCILIDDVDLMEMNLSSWRRRIGYVTQDVIVFNDTVRNNLTFAHPEAMEDDIERCMRLAHFTEVVAELPEGLDTVLGEGGVRLSGGQKQRLALARALIGKPELLLLDEATSALDNESERLIQEAIESIAHTMTIIVIAHRLSTVRKVDVIYVMEAGRMVETGTYEELVAENGTFAELHKLQFA
jgi:ABC-type multidrug transport system fused ATPase/permease subunit